MTDIRAERDLIGTLEVPASALYGIHSMRARENFPDHTAFHLEWYKALGVVKMAAYQTCLRYREALLNRISEEQLPGMLTSPGKLTALFQAAREMADGRHADSFIVPAISGGAGTSIHMNINEILTNRALQLLGFPAGTYTEIDPLETANLFQSTNDVVPTALRIAAMRMLTRLEEHINHLRAAVERQESKGRSALRIGYTQMQEAVPSSFGLLFSTYSDALSRDWWRVSKCFERIKAVNLGGGAIGTGMGIPRFFIMEVVPALQQISGLPVARAENMADATSQLDAWVEVHATLKAHAVNLEKMSADLRLLASDILGQPEVSLPNRQMGSTIMPGKVNPVIPEFVISIAHKVYANDMLITSLCSQGTLELNAYLPLIGHAVLESLSLLAAADTSMHHHLINDLIFHPENSLEKLCNSPAITTALLPYIGYHKASEMAVKMKQEKMDVFASNLELGFLTDVEIRSILRPENLLKRGYSLQDMMVDTKQDEQQD